MEIFKTFKNPVNIFIFIAIFTIIFDLNYILTKNLPGHINNMCVNNGVITPGIMAYILILSFLTSLLLLAIIETIKHKTLKTKSMAGITGSAIGTLVVFCPACTIPTITIFGFAISTQFFLDYELAIRIISITLILIGLWIVNSQLKDDCKICKI